MKCRPNCAACCIAISISSPIPGLPDGKAAGEPCIHLDDDLQCKIFNHPDRPKTCANFTAEVEFCGSNQADAMRILSSLEKSIQ